MKCCSRPGYQITNSDKPGWEKTCLCLGTTENEPINQTKQLGFYPKLSHLKHDGKGKPTPKANPMNEVFPLLAVLTMVGRGPLRTLAGAQAPRGVLEGGEGSRRGCGTRYAPCMLEQDSLPPACCLSATPSSRLGGKGQDEKKKTKKPCRLLTGLLRRGGHTQEEGEARCRLGGSSEILLLISFVNTS